LSGDEQGENTHVESLRLTTRREREEVSGPVAGRKLRKVGRKGTSLALTFPRSWFEQLNTPVLEVKLVDDAESDEWVIVIRRPRV